MNPTGDGNGNPYGLPKVTALENRLRRTALFDEGTDISCPVKMFLKKLVKNLMTF